MEPITTALIVLGVVALLGTTTALNWDGIMLMLKGKRVSVLGARGVGKTHLVQFLSKGGSSTKAGMAKSFCV